MRTHLIISEELLRQIDATVGKRRRSRFVEEAVREKLRREMLVAALSSTAGLLSAEAHPEWGTPDEVATWVRESRRRDEQRLGSPTRG
ncbi:MAG: hypothetical protein EXR55_00745 [Dehalococcoidia bacterium]|nr:hypothetical protein [Dehalococcoidia bacterium]